MPTLNLPALDIVYKEAFVMQPLYRVTHKWLGENDYADSGGDSSLESSGEVLYHFRKGTTVSPGENELRIWWRTQKSVSAFYVHHLDIDWNVIQMYNIEIMRNGNKQKVQKGELRINIKPYINIPDMSRTTLLKFFDNWIRTRLVKKNLEENRKILYQDAYRLQGMIKKYLELKTFIPEQELLHEKFDAL